MVKKRMAMRMVTIFVALIVCGMFFPGLARGATGDSPLTTDKYTVEFKDLQLNEESSIPVKITNESDAPLTLIPQFSSEGDCQFGYEYPGSDVSWIIHLAARDSLDITFTYTPSNYEECGAEFKIVDIQAVTLATITLIGVLEEETTEDPKYISVGEIKTDVEDKMADADNSIGDLIKICEDTAWRHGHLVRCVGLLTRELWAEEIISYQDRCELNRAATKAGRRRMMREMETARSSGRADHRSSKHWQWNIWSHLRHR